MASKKGKESLIPCHPGLFITTELIQEAGLEIPEIAAMLGVEAAAVADLVNGKTRLTPEMALRLEKAFDLKMDLLLPIQAWYDEVQMRARWDEVEVQVFDWARHLAKADGGKGETGGEVAPQAGFEPAT